MSLGVDWMIDWVRTSAAVIAAHRVELITLDRDIGDGDHGENMDRGFSAVIAKLDGLPADAIPADVLKLVATTLISTVGGAAGPLYGTAYLKAAGAVAGLAELDGSALAALLRAARDGIVLRGKAESGDKTMVDAWTPAVDAADAAVGQGADVAASPRCGRGRRGAGCGGDRAAHRAQGARQLPGRTCDRAPRPRRPVDGPAAAGGGRRRRRRGGTMTVGLVFVSHSAKIAEGLVELARQMAPDVALVAAGGMDDGGIGTSFDLVTAAIARAESGDGVVILCDLGSAILTAETALDFLDDDERSRVDIVDAPLVEGGVAAAVAAQTGAGPRRRRGGRPDRCSAGRGLADRNTFAD